MRLIILKLISCLNFSCNKGPDSDKPNFTLWMKDLKKAYEKEDLLLVAAVSPLSWISEAAYEIQELDKYVDYTLVKTYEFRGSWDGQTGLGAPLYAPIGDKTCKDIVRG